MQFCGFLPRYRNFNTSIVQLITDQLHLVRRRIRIAATQKVDDRLRKRRGLYIGWLTVPGTFGKVFDRRCIKKCFNKGRRHSRINAITLNRFNQVIPVSSLSIRRTAFISIRLRNPNHLAMISWSVVARRLYNKKISEKPMKMLIVGLLNMAL